MGFQTRFEILSVHNRCQFSPGKLFQKAGPGTNTLALLCWDVGQAVRTCCSLINEVARGGACSLSARECQLCSADCDQREHCALSEQLKDNPVPYWKPVELALRWRHMIERSASANKADSGVLDSLQRHDGWLRKARQKRLLKIPLQCPAVRFRYISIVHPPGRTSCS